MGEAMDIFIRNGTIYDPETGFHGRKNIAVKDGRIAALTDELLAADTIIDAEGLYVVPGFIDIHIHEDTLTEDQINYSTECAALRMGVTTVVGGNCGFSPENLGKYIAYLQKQGAPVNTMMLQGYNTIRGKFFTDAQNQSAYRQGDVYASVSEAQIEQAKEEVKKSLELGAAGLSFGLEYTPGCSFHELTSVCSVLKDFPNALITVHYRHDAGRCLDSIRECIQLSKETGVPLEFSHIGSCAGYGDKRYMEEALTLLQTAREESIDITADCYPYNAFSTLIGSTVFDDGALEKWGVSYDAILPIQGKFKNCACTREIFDYLRKEEPDTRVVCFAMKEENVFRAYKDDAVIVASDGKFVENQGHARTAGTFPRVLGLLCRERGILSFEEAIKKMTLLPANRMHLTEKGRLQVGKDADITILDRNAVREGNTFVEPAKAPLGIAYVIVNGNIAMCHGEIQSASDGVFINRQDS